MDRDLVVRIAERLTVRGRAARAVTLDATGVGWCESRHIYKLVTVGAPVRLCALHPDIVRCAACMADHLVMHQCDCDACGIRATNTTTPPVIEELIRTEVHAIANWCSNDACLELVAEAGQIAGMELWFAEPCADTPSGS